MPDTEAAPTDVGAALDAARPNIDTVDAVNGAVVVAHRDDVLIDTHDLERFAANPTRSRGNRAALTADGFTDLVKRFGYEGTTVYANVDSCSLVAVLNDDYEDPGWRDDRVTFTPTPTPEWKHWTEHQGLTEQGKFAEVIEAGETEIRTPSATIMLQIAETFHASTQAKFKQAGRLKDGRVQLVYEEDIDAAAGEGLVAIPDVFVIEVRPFYGAEPVSVECRLRYRLDRGELKIGYFIHRPAEILRESFIGDVKAQVAEQVPYPVVDAHPPASPAAR